VIRSGRTRRGPFAIVACAVAALLSLVALLCPAPVAAQEPLVPALQDPVADSAQERIRERLRRLARPVGADSVLFEADSALLAEAAAGVRPQFRGGDDPVLSVLTAMPGYTLTRYEGEGADFGTADRVLVLRAPAEGRARVNREGLEVQADSSIIFQESTGLMRTVGMSTFTPPDNDPVDAVNMIYDLNQARGSALGARTEFNEGGTRWFMTGDMPWAATDSTFMSHARFTSCDLEVPHYHFEANEIKVVGGRILVARGVRLYFADVPVAWLPFLAQDLQRGRSSGLLTPRFSLNDIVRSSSGYRRRVSNLGFYWAMSDYTDARIAFDWFSDTFVSMNTGFQYAWNRQFLTGRVDVSRYWGADGSAQFAFDTNHDWEPDERTRLGISARYAQSDFVRDYSFDPREVTQQITSNGGVNRRFDWGTLSVNGTRNQYLSDDRVEWTLPQANLSFTSRTLFRAPTTQARFYNNMTWSASTAFARSTVDRMQVDTFSFARADTDQRNASASTSLGLGNLRLQPSVSLREARTLSVPEALLQLGPGEAPDPADLLASAPARDVGQATVTWRTSLNYQQRLIGSTTLTPDLSLSGDLFRADTSSLASNFVAAPSRVSLGATLRSDVYGFFPGVGPFDLIRHKVTPSITYAWTPEASPTELQRQVFGRAATRPRNVVAITFNQTFEGRRRPADPREATRERPPAGGPGEAIRAADEEGLPAGAAGLAEDPGIEGAEGPGEDLTAAAASDPGAPRRIERPQVVTLLGLTTSVVRYDFVEADSSGFFLAGFETTQLSNQITSDYLRGLSISMQHELFTDSLMDGTLVERRFQPHLASVNLGFSLSSRSGIFRWLGGIGRGDARPLAPQEEDPDDFDDPFEDDDMLAEGSMIPGGRGSLAPGQDARRSGVGEWNANISYALQRPRRDPDRLSQMLSGGLRIRPTENWDLNWRTAYDLEARGFNDHVIRLTRDLHRWQAHFDFLQTATGNWSFRFEVSLTDNRDLKFDYRQRNLDVGVPGGR